MEGICGANCSECELFKCDKCKGCESTKGCPFGKKCWIAKYIEVGGNKSFDILKNELKDEINMLGIEGMPKIDELYPLHGAFVNLEYSLPSGNKVKFLDDDMAYLGNQVECIFNDNEVKKYFGVVCDMNFILISEYEDDGKNSEIICYKRR